MIRKSRAGEKRSTYSISSFIISSRRHIVSAAIVPQTRYSWTHPRPLLGPVPEARAEAVGIQIFGGQRPRPDNAHIPAQHIE